MYFRTLAFTFLVLSQVCYAQGRKPAVEDFVGIEVEHPENTPQGTESLFNFEKDISKFEDPKIESKKTSRPKAVTKIQEPPMSLTAIIGIAFFLGLPAIIWFTMMNHLRQKAHIQSASNIQVLENYRREKEEAKKTQEAYKKVS